MIYISMYLNVGGRRHKPKGGTFAYNMLIQLIQKLYVFVRLISKTRFDYIQFIPRFLVFGKMIHKKEQ